MKVGSSIKYRSFLSSGFRIFVAKKPVRRFVLFYRGESSDRRIEPVVGVVVIALRDLADQYRAGPFFDLEIVIESLLDGDALARCKAYLCARRDRVCAAVGMDLDIAFLVDGFIMTACALAAIQLHPEVKDFMIFAHCGDESGHKKMLDFLEVKPLLNLGLRLGEGTGALCAYPIVDSAVRMINEMNNFQNANITKYF